jgi:hypothetical protein
MLQPFLENTTKIIWYILLWVAYALLQSVVLYSLVALPLEMIFLDGFVHATIFAILGLLLWSVIEYGNYAVLTMYQRMINYIGLALLTITVWLGTGYGLFYLIYSPDLALKFVPVLPIRAFIGLLIYLLIIQRFRFQLPIEEEDTDIPAPVEVSEDAKLKKVAETELLERIAVKSGSKIHVVMVPEIIYLQADGDYVQIFTEQAKFLKEQTMKYFEEHLPDNQFVRVHRSVIVNVEMISRIELYEKQSQLLTLKTGQQIKASPAGYKALRAVLNL